MPNDSVTVVPSVPWEKVFFSQNATALSFATLLPTGTSPTAGDGVLALGAGGMHTARQVELLPYCEGLPGQSFSVRVYSWRELRGSGDSQVWVPQLLAELACTAGILGGPNRLVGTNPSLRRILEGEYFCDQISLTVGGAVLNVPGPDLVASAMVETRGAKYLQFDFQQTDPVAGMNCLWTKL